MTKRILLVLGAIFAIAAPAAAQSSVGVRAGLSGDPDQFVFGGHYESDELIDRVTFRPNAEIGVGDNQVVFAINLEFAYSIPLQNRDWRLYAGGGPAVNIRSFDDDHPGHAMDDDVGGGFNVILGIQHERGLFTEIKVGAMDSPSVKFVVGYVFQ